MKAFVDFQNDVTAKDIELAVREGLRSIEHVKRYTTTGMATDQGKTSNMNALAIAADALGQADPRGRAHHVPPALYAGDLRRLRRAIRAATCSIPSAARRSMTGRRSSGAVFEDVGLWKRAWYFPQAGEDMHAAVARECRAVRDERRHLRRLHARQDRGRRPGRGRVHEPHLHQSPGRSSSPAAAATA